MEVQLPVLLENHDRKINQPTSGHQPNQRTDMRGHREVTHTHHKINILAYIFTYTTTEKHNTHTQTLTHTHTLHTPESIVYPETGRLIILSLSHHTSPLHTHTNTHNDACFVSFVSPSPSSSALRLQFSKDRQHGGTLRARAHLWRSYRQVRLKFCVLYDWSIFTMRIVSNSVIWKIF